MLDFNKPVKDTICEAFAKSLGVDISELDDDVRPVADLEAQSVNYVHVVSAIEKTYDITVPFMQLRRRKTIADMVEFIEELREE